jgi:hypothetical protein
MSILRMSWQEHWRSIALVTPLAGDLRKPLARTHVVSQQCDPIYGFGPLRSRIILALELFLHIVPATTVVACRAGIRIFTKRK